MTGKNWLLLAIADIVGSFHRGKGLGVFRRRPAPRRREAGQCVVDAPELRVGRQLARVLAKWGCRAPERMYCRR